MNKKLIRLYTKNEEYIGYIVCENKDNVILKSYDESGKYKEYILLRKDYIVKEEKNNSDLDDIQYLIDNKVEYIEDNKDLSFTKEKNLLEMLETLMKKKTVCKLILNDFHSIYGVICKIDKDYVYTENSYAKISEIRNIYCDFIFSRKELYLKKRDELQ